VQQQEVKGSGLKARVQRLGSRLSSMIMPVIGSLIAWGILTALFIPDGYLPNEQLAEMVGPLLNYLIPILIAYQGGKLVYGERGAVVGAIAASGVIVGSSDPQLLGAMIAGPLGGWVIKKFDDLFQDSVPTGFEMLVNNFSSGILGFALAILGFYGISPLMAGITGVLSAGVEWLAVRNLLPLTNLFIEPAKPLFLNNAVNHGVLTTLGAQSGEASVLYLLEANPGPGLGILLAYMFFGKGAARSSASGAAIIHFIGGIHELYFPYVLMKPLMFFAAIAGGVAGTFTNVMLGSALNSPASPGSILAVLGVAAPGTHMAVIAGVLAGAAASFAVAALILKMDRSTEDDLDAAVAKTQAAKAESKGQVPTTGTVDAGSDSVAEGVEAVDSQLVNKIIFACDAGMGSSAMGASLMKKKAKEADVSIDITNSSVANLQDEEGLLVITQEELTERAKQHAPGAVHVSVDNFLSSPKYDEVINRIKDQQK
jgi:PTS system mannitol-specific IIC component